MEGIKRLMKDGKVLLIIVLLLVIIIMTIGVTILASALKNQETTTIVTKENWGIKISDIQVIDQTATANPGTPSHTDSTVTLAATLNVPGDAVTYEITVQNTGTMDAVLESQTFIEGMSATDSSLIVYTYSQLSDDLKAGETTKFTVTATYDAMTTQDQIDASLSRTKTIIGTFNYKQK